ncbi:MAG: septum formation initiator family protein [Gloeobacteraceae cyanobacterium ES-bin-316]|nr:septum formation initiator family protein [Ferruginibacter sp.]
MKVVHVLFSVLKNKYLIASLLFLVWMLFFDEKDWRMIGARKDKLNQLQKSEQHLAASIKDTRVELDLLKTNAQTIEQYAREKYFMKKDNEDLFIVNSEE